MYKQRGLSLVELMVGLAIGLFVIGGISTSFLATQITNRDKAIIDAEQERLRFIEYVLGRVIRQSSSIIDTSTSTQLVVNYPGNNSATIKDCTGAPAANAQTDTFVFSGTTLSCNNEILIDGISSLSFSYGVDANDNSVIEDSEYISNPGSTDWSNIISIRVQLTYGNNKNTSFVSAMRPAIVLRHGGSGLTTYIPPIPEDPAPQDPAPQDPAPQDPAPQDPAPQDPAPQDPAPQDPAPKLCSIQFKGKTGPGSNSRTVSITSPDSVKQPCAASGNGSNRAYTCPPISTNENTSVTLKANNLENSKTHIVTCSNSETMPITINFP